MPAHQKYLLIIDDAPMDTKLSDYFAQFDYTVIQQNDLSQLNKNVSPPSALIINWSFCRNNSMIINDIYQNFCVPLIIISDQFDEKVCIQALETGADDFLIKPLHPRELHARITAITRRVQRTQELESEKDVYLFSDWCLYPASRQIFNKDTQQELALSVGEYDLLLAFVHQPQQVLGREFLLQLTKNSDLNPFDRRIDVQISRLRQKIEIDAKKPALIKTIRNGGYLFTAPVVLIKN